MKKFLFIAALFCAAVFTSCKEDEQPTGKVQSITLAATASVDVGEKITLTATVEPADATNGKLLWESSEKAVASVTQTGVVSGMKAGVATITVTTEDGTLSATCTVTVVLNGVPVTGVTLNRTTLDLLPGESMTLTPTITPDDATDKSVTWSVKDPAVATVSNTGEVTAVGNGSTTVTVHTVRGSKTASCVVTVSNKMAAVAPGDFYYDDNTYSKVFKKDKKCLGIVFWVSFSEINVAKIVALDETDAAFIANGVVSTLGAPTSKIDGITNKHQIIALEEYSTLNYPAMAFCQAKGASYYLPGVNELQSIYQHRILIETSLREAGAPNTVLAGELLSSTVDVDTKTGTVKAYKLIAGDVLGTSVAGSTVCRVRAVLPIEL